MAPRPTSLLLWLTLVLCVPVPFFLVETGYQPAVALMQLLAFTLTLIAAEGSSGAVVLAAGMIAAQILIGVGALTVVTMLVTRVLDRSLGQHAVYGVGLLVAVLVAVALTQPIYRTPFRTGGLHATLGQVFE